MAYNKSTGHDPTPVLSPETRTAFDVLLTLAAADTKSPAQAAVQKVIDGFDRVGRVGSPRRMCIVINGQDDLSLDPRFLGDPPVPEPDGSCSYCGDPYDQHWNQDTEDYQSGREWHRRDRDNDGYYSDEIRVVAR